MERMKVSKNREEIFYDRVEKLLALIANALIVDSDYMTEEAKIDYKYKINGILDEE